ncbi:MAG: hypothetical protein ACRCXZ_10440 [Patescibacteria group bacterium]
MSEVNIDNSDFGFRIGIANEIINYGLTARGLSAGHALCYGMIYRKSCLFNPTSRFFDSDNYFGTHTTTTVSLYPENVPELGLPSWRLDYVRDIERFNRIVKLSDLGRIHPEDSTCFVDVDKETYAYYFGHKNPNSLINKAKRISYDFLDDNCILFAAKFFEEVSGYRFDTLSPLGYHSPIVLANSINRYNKSNANDENLDAYIFAKERAEREEEERKFRALES